MPPYVAGNLSYADGFQAAVRSVVLSLPAPGQVNSAVYSSACFKHCTSTLAWGSFWGVRVDDVSLRSYLGAWYFGGQAPSSASGATGQLPSGPGSLSGGAAVPALHSQWVEQCNGFGCGQCHGQAAEAPPSPPSYLRNAPSRRRASGLIFWGLVSLIIAVSVVALSNSGGAMPLRSRGGSGAGLEMPSRSELAPLRRPAPSLRT